MDAFFNSPMLVFLVHLSDNNEVMYNIPFYSNFIPSHLLLFIFEYYTRSKKPPQKFWPV